MVGSTSRVPSVWVPESTAPELLALLPREIALHELPSRNALPDHLGIGHFLVAPSSGSDLAELIPRLTELHVVQTISAGVDGLIDLVPPGVTLCDGSGIHDIPVAEWVLMAMLAMSHELVRHLDSQRNSHWQSGTLEAGGDDLEGAAVLLLGYGSIGRALEERLNPFRVSLMRVGRHKRESVFQLADLPSLLPKADVVVILLPLTAETRGLVDASFLSMMHEGALLVNASRGPIVRTEALTEAVLVRRIKAAMDVTDPEPLPDGHALWSAPGVMITPHVAGWVRKRQHRAWRFIGDQLRRFLEGEPLLNVVSDGY